MVPWDDAFEMLVKSVANLVFYNNSETEEENIFFCCPNCKKAYYKIDNEYFETEETIPKCKECKEKMI